MLSEIYEIIPPPIIAAVIAAIISSIMAILTIIVSSLVSINATIYNRANELFNTFEEHHFGENRCLYDKFSQFLKLELNITQEWQELGFNSDFQNYLNALHKSAGSTILEIASSPVPIFTYFFKRNYIMGENMLCYNALDAYRAAKKKK